LRHVVNRRVPFAHARRLASVSRVRNGVAAAKMVGDRTHACAGVRSEES
jgi:hypothetical protein